MGAMEPGAARFNEAPAERGGKRPCQCWRGQGAVLASMRPPLNAGENGQASKHAVPIASQLQ